MRIRVKYTSLGSARKVERVSEAWIGPHRENG